MSIFSGKDEIINSFLGLSDGERLKQVSTSRSLNRLNKTQREYDSLVRDLYLLVEQNRGVRKPSAQNWRDTRQTSVSADNKSPEVLLERAIAILGQRGILPGWYNQVPVASGLVDSYSDKRAAVDLARIDGDQAALIELKWESDTPAFAAFEILLYGLVYLFCYVNKLELGYSDKTLMQVKKMSLQVLAPAEYYPGYELGELVHGLDTAVQAISEEQTDGRLAMDYGFRCFSRGFESPFDTGIEVSALKDLPVDDKNLQYLVGAINAIDSVY